MKSSQLRRTTIICVLAGLLAAPAVMAQSATEILQKVDEVGRAETSRIAFSQQVKTPGGDTRSFKIIGLTGDGGAKGLSEYVSPNQVRGMKILTLNEGDDIWVFFPRTNRTRKIASSARNRRVQGSDFTYDDMASGKLAKHWNGRVAGQEKINGKQCHKLEVTPTPSGPRSYSKAIIWVDTSSYTVPRIEYFDTDGDKIKRLTLEDYRSIAGVQIPHRYAMTNLTDGGHTTMTATKVEVNIKLNARVFTEAALGR